MARYIDADELKIKYSERHYQGMITDSEYYNLIIPLDYAQTADVRPNVIGEWIANNSFSQKCNKCGFSIHDWDWHRFNFCPNCGADMRGEKDG